LLAKAVCQAMTMSGGPTSSRASALLQWMACIQRVRVQLEACMPVEIACIRRGCISIARGCTTFVGAGLLAKAACQAMTMSGGPTSSRASALLQWKLRAFSGLHVDRAGLHHIRRSRLAGEGGVSGEDDVGWADVFAGKRAPTMEWRASSEDDFSGGRFSPNL
jgi:hypothetical protein